MLKFLNSGPARLATLLLVAQAAVLYSSIRPEAIPPVRALSEMPKNVTSWKFVQEGVVDPESQAILKADDLLNREFVSPPDNVAVNLFIAAFRSQRNGKAPHSPKNCLPGNGWTPLQSEIVPVDVGRAAPIQVNQFIVEHGDYRSVVLYWYQSRDRAVASEYRAKFWVIADAIRYNRTDTALVRVVVPIINRDQERALRTATGFIKDFYGTIRDFLPA